MSTVNKILVLLLPLALAGLLGACGKSDDKRTVAGAAGDSLLQYVPADSPYVVAQLAPLDDDVMDMLEPRIDKVLKAYADVLHAGLEHGFSEEATEDLSEEEWKKMQALGGVFAELLSVEGMRSAGIGRESTMVLYGNGLLPVLRIALTDAALMEKTIARIESEAGAAMDTARVGDVSYRTAGDDDAEVVLALVGNDLVVGLVPSEHSEDLLKSVLGITLPSSSMAESGELQKLQSEFGYIDYLVMKFDIERLADTFVTEQTGINKELLQLADYDQEELSDECKAEIREVAQIMPRIVGGATAFDTELSKFAILMDLRDDIASGLSKLVAPVQGLGTVEGELFAFGMSVDLIAARDFYAGRLDALEADPYECELFEKFQSDIAETRSALNQPVPPIVYTIKGFLASVDAIEGLDMTTKQPPTSVDASFLLAVENPEALVAAGAMFSPDLAALDIPSDGKPVPLPLPPVSPALSQAFIAMNAGGLAFSVGSEGEARLTSLMGAKFAEPPPFMSMNLDVARYYAFMAEAMRNAEVDDEDDEAMPPEVQEKMADAMVAMQHLYSRESLDVGLTAKGVEMRAITWFAEN